MLSVLAVDDEPSALAQLTGLLMADTRVERVLAAREPVGALRDLGRLFVSGERLDGVFLDIQVPDLGGLDFARLFGGFAHPPPVVFVAAREDFAVPAFEFGAIDYLLKPVRPERLAESVRRVDEAVRRREEPARRRADVGRADVGRGDVSLVRREWFDDQATPGSHASAAAFSAPAAAGPAGPDGDGEVIPVELAGRVLMVPLTQVRYVEAQGDYVRLHTTSGDSYLLRTPLRTLARRWRGAGFVRIHRSTLVSTRHISELRRDDGRVFVQVAERRLQVSRRLTRSVHDLLVRRFHEGLKG
jgi:DNA-binding LytR/AlgR family response regulator